MEVLYFVTSGAHRTIPLEELEALHEVYDCPLEVLSIHYNLVLAKGKYGCSKKIMNRAAYIKEMGLVCAICDEASCDWFVDCEFHKVKKKKLGGLEGPELMISGRGEGTARLVVTEGFGVLGKGSVERKRGRSLKGPFFSPGSMDPLLARAMVNLSRAKEGERFLDPFCGTGVIAHEASRVGAVSLCADLDPSMVYGSRINSEHLGLSCEHVLQDSAEFPLRSSSIGAIATDPPYGRSVVSLGHDVSDLFSSFLREAARVLKPRSWLSFAMSISLDPEEVMNGVPLKLKKCHVMRVHRSLARYICTAYTG